MVNRMASPSDSGLNQMLMQLMNPQMQQGRGLAPNQRVEQPKPAQTNTGFDQSQQPGLGSLVRQPMQQQQQMPMQDQMPRLPNQMISPSPEMMARLLAQTMFSGRR